MKMKIAGAVLAVIAILGFMTLVIDMVLLRKDTDNIEENIKYLRLIKRKLTQDLPKIKNEKIYTKYKTIIEKIDRAEDEYTKTSRTQSRNIAN